MKATGAPDSPYEHLAEEALAALFAGRQVRYGVACPGAASPSYHGVESATYLVADSPGAEPATFLKVSEPAAGAWLDPAAAFRVATRIAGLGLAPEPLHLSPDQGAILFRRLGPEWRPATLDILRRPDRMGAVIGAFGRIAEGEPFGTPWSVFDGIRRMRTLLGEGADTLPPDAWFLFDWGETIAAALGAAGTDRRPVHGDPHASNLLFDPNGALRFVDFDMGCDADPHYQLAAFLNEACQFESDMRLGIEIAEGTCRPAVFSRCRAYGAADDLYWGLRALVMDKVSPRRSLEFRKYASWRLLRCRMRVTRPDFEEILRSL
ncbi:aminoglycoside phosphotransferase family protein [Methylobacterium sp. J-067]|uniref:aminoglycoside phosphotransferase family protein n=1 Tax=Methylobacterium sp. J-067 TaxID=2836648 RepID=UPI001FB98823|nr:aminoglycoside phosphotransferase family protein [Methylobacterium sp. J-067]MCJ2022647.1 aminoglycoside phosphotransferase family protein [Methylobacterium sp. J-067]